MLKRYTFELEFLDKTRPKWNYWLALPTWTLHEAVMLSIGVDPQYAGDDFEWFRESDDFVSDWDFSFKDEARMRADIANRWLNVPVDDGGLREPESLRGPGIRPQRFVELCRRLNFDLPPELSGANVEGALVSCGRWPWGDHETELLKLLAEAVRQHWEQYDSTDPNMAPSKNAEVADWIRDQLVARGLREKGSATSLAKCMATIIGKPKVGRPKSRKRD